VLRTLFLVVLTSARMPVVTERTMPYSNARRQRPEALMIFESKLQPAGIDDGKRLTYYDDSPSVLLICDARATCCKPCNSTPQCAKESVTAISIRKPFALWFSADSDLE
jgi:hypothetical protein